MSDDEDQKSQAEQSVQEEENPEPPLLVKKEQITMGLSRIQRTASTFVLLSNSVSSRV